MFAPILIASILAFASLSSPTHADDQRSTDTAACKSARLSAWFERQRQLTDGDFVAGRIATPRECTTTYGANAADEAAPGKQLVTTAKVPQQPFPGTGENVALTGA
jgi:hypothetical protein